MNKLKNWWKSWVDKNSNEYANRVEKNCKREAEDTVQPMVWNNKLYLSYQGIPLIEASELKGEFLDSIESSQRTVCCYAYEKLMDY